MFRSIASLVLIGSICGALLAGANRLTRADIEANRSAETRALMQQLAGQELPQSANIDASGSCDTWFFSAQTTQGYAGPVHALVFWRAGAADPTASARVLTHVETPGIGTFIEHERDPWMASHDGKSRAQWQSIDNVTGATITANAIKRAVASAFSSIAEKRCG